MFGLNICIVIRVTSRTGVKSCSRTPRGVPANIVAAMAEQVLIDHTFFVAAKADVPDLHFANHNEDLDHGSHETRAFLLTDEPPNDVRNRNIEEFVESLHSASVV